MSAQVTEAHLELAKTALFSRDAAGRLLTAPMAAQVIADSEAAAVQIAMLREYGNLCATNESLAKGRDQLRAETQRLGRATTNGQLAWMQESDRANARAERAEAEVKRLKSDGAASAFVNMSCRASHAEAELAAERARLDYIDSLSPGDAWIVCPTGDFANAQFRAGDARTLRALPGIRAAIDAAMKQPNT